MYYITGGMHALIATTLGSEHWSIIAPVTQDWWVIVCNQVAGSHITADGYPGLWWQYEENMKCPYSSDFAISYSSYIKLNVLPLCFVLICSYI